MAEVRVRAADISIGPRDKAVITETALVDALVRHQDESMRLLGTIHPVTLEEISIDDEGRIVVANEEFAKKLREIASSEVELEQTNVGCLNILCVEF